MLHEILQQEFLGNPVSNYALAMATVAIGLAAVQIIETIIIRRLKKWTEHTENDLDDRLISLVDRSLIPILYVTVFYLAFQDLIFSETIDEVIRVVGTVALTVFIIRFVNALIASVLEFYWLTKRDEITRTKSLSLLLPAIRIIIWAIGMVFLLDNLGFQISAVLTSLGIGGVAIGLASQGLFEDVFSYFAILLDSPFEISDFLVIGDFAGTVEHIGVKTTRIRSLEGEQVIFSNKALTNSRIQNYKRMYRRRIAFQIGITYDTPLEKLRQIPNLIKDTIVNTQSATFDRAHFFAYGDFSLIYEIVYYVNSNDYNIYMDVQQQINFTIKQEFEQRAIEFAFPTQTLHVSNNGGESNGNNSNNHKAQNFAAVKQ
ncbi:mechanosensitive ion channel family protein [Thalassoporum mexicanum]|uniref:mechanosensitive ion channel family protein n=1 Tax=Thalassoporum mexicanum TaxID=3457544 RepID=UPI000683F4F4|nr:mechanosensitive ion channel family protein [Pseudanabaena sp. PCC 7367]